MLSSHGLLLEACWTRTDSGFSLVWRHDFADTVTGYVRIPAQISQSTARLLTVDFCSSCSSKERGSLSIR